MAISPSAKYPAQIATDANYPLGKARNALVDGDGTGTPLEETWLNDLWGFFQALLDAAGASPTETPDQVGASQYLDAIKYLISHVADAVAFAAAVTFNGTITANAAALFNAVATFTAGASFEDGIDVDGAAATVHGNPLIVKDSGGVLRFEINPATAGIFVLPIDALYGIDFTGGTKGITRRVKYASDADATLGVADGDVLVFRSSVMSATRTIKLADGSDGQELILLNTSPMYAQTLQNSAGGVLLAAPNTLPALSGSTPGKIHLIWGNYGAGSGWIGA